MERIGLFEAKTKLSELCERVAVKGEPIVITRRGRPLVRIEPIAKAGEIASSVWDLRARYEKKHGALREDFTLEKRQKQQWRDPLK